MCNTSNISCVPQNSRMCNTICVTQNGMLLIVVTFFKNNILNLLINLSNALPSCFDNGVGSFPFNVCSEHIFV